MPCTDIRAHMTMTPAWYIALLMALLLPDVHGQDFLVSPKNQAIIAGEQVLFECQPMEGDINGFVWQHGSTDLITFGIIVAPNYIDRVDLISDDVTKMYNIKMNNTVLDDALEYSCAALSPPPGLTYCSQLIVLARKPECSPNVNLADLLEGDEFTVSCKASYKALWEPHIMCRDSNSLEVPTDNTGSLLGKLDSFFTVSSADRAQHGQFYQCTITFPEPPEGILPPNTPEKKYNRNASNYEFVYSTDNLNVQFPVENLFIPDLKLEYYPGERITSQAGGRPAPTTRWLKIQLNQANSSLMIQGNILYIDKSMEGFNEYRCESWNEIKGVVYNINKTITFTVIIPTTQSTTPTTTPTLSPSTTELPPPLSAGAIAGIVIGCILGLLVIAVIIFLIFFQRMSTETSSKKMKQPLSVPSKPQQDPIRHMYVNGGMQHPIQQVPDQKPVDDLQYFIRDNQPGSRRPLPAKETTSLSPPQNDWI